MSDERVNVEFEVTQPMDARWKPRERGVPAVPGLHPNARQIIAHTTARHWHTLMPDEFDGRPIEFDYRLADRILEALEAANRGVMAPPATPPTD